MEYRAKSHFDALTWLLLNGLMWIGAAGLAWHLFKPGGWLFWAIERILNDQPTSYYFLGLGALGLIAAKAGLDSIDPRLFQNLVTAGCAFAGTLFILGTLLPI